MSLEESLEKRGGKKFGPTGGRKLTIFLDDISMPEGTLFSSLRIICCRYLDHEIFY